MPTSDSRRTAQHKPAHGACCRRHACEQAEEDRALAPFCPPEADESVSLVLQASQHRWRKDARQELVELDVEEEGHEEASGAERPSPVEAARGAHERSRLLGPRLVKAGRRRRRVIAALAEALCKHAHVFERRVRALQGLELVRGGERAGGGRREEGGGRRAEGGGRLACPK